MPIKANFFRSCTVFFIADWSASVFILASAVDQMCDNYGGSGVIGTSHYPPRKKLKQRRNADCGTNYPAALYCVLCVAHFS